MVKTEQNFDKGFHFTKNMEQAGAELCQAQHSLSLDLVTNWLGLITQLWLELEA